MKLKKLSAKLITKTIFIGILALNGIGYTSAYLFTHYQSEEKFSLGVPKSQNYNSPQDFNLEYTTHKIVLSSNEWLDSWLIKSKALNSQGVVILFHGKDNSKSSLLDSAKIFHHLGYDTLLVDFRGSGKSSGNITTVGVGEAKDVVAAVNYLQQLKVEINVEKPVILYGISMGSAAILRAIAYHDIQPDAIILELPFATLLSSVKRRLSNSYLPPSPMAELIVFWGGTQHGFNAFQHQPLADAKAVKCPTLILAGERDSTVAISEIEQLYQNLNVPKNMVVFPEAGHQLLAKSHQELWSNTVKDFLKLLMVSG
jgi:uncharacterized protein